MIPRLLRFYVTRSTDGYAAQCYDEPGIVACGDTREELAWAVDDAVEAWAGPTHPHMATLVWPENQKGDSDG